MNFRISGQKVNIMKETKYLGMVMDEYLNLTFKNHYGHCEAKTKQSKWFISQVKPLC